jgi:hypothetical protein
MLAMFDIEQKESYLYRDSMLKQIYVEVINPVLIELVSKEISKICATKQETTTITKELYDYFTLICIHGRKASDVLYKELCTKEAKAQTQAEFDKMKAEHALIIKRWLDIIKNRESAEAYINTHQDKLSRAKIEHQNDMAKLLDIK